MKGNDMNDIMRAMLLQMLQSYVEMSMYSVQKLMLTQRRPNQWQIDNAFQSMFQNVPQYAMQAQQPLQELNKPIDLNAITSMIGQLSNQAPQQPATPQPTTTP